MIDRDVAIALFGGSDEWYQFEGIWICNGHVATQCEGLEGTREWTQGCAKPSMEELSGGPGFEIAEKCTVMSIGCIDNNAAAVEWISVGKVRYRFEEGPNAEVSEMYHRFFLAPYHKVGRKLGGDGCSVLVGLDVNGAIQSIVMPLRPDLVGA